MIVTHRIISNEIVKQGVLVKSRFPKARSHKLVINSMTLDTLIEHDSSYMPACRESQTPEMY